MVRLRRSSPDRPGWTRRRAGKGFVYLDERRPALVARGRPAGQGPGDPARVAGRLDLPVAERPPAGGRYRRRRPAAVPLPPRLAHPARRREVRRRCSTFGKALSKAREQVLVDLGAEGMTQERACAVAVRLLDLGYFRIGNDVYAEENGSFGLTTLERRHVRTRGQDAGLRLRRASPGSSTAITIDDPGAVEALEVMRRRRGGDDRLLAWKDGRRWRPVDSVARQRVRRAHDRAWRRRPRTSAPGTRP